MLQSKLMIQVQYINWITHGTCTVRKQSGFQCDSMFLEYSLLKRSNSPDFTSILLNGTLKQMQTKLK